MQPDPSGLMTKAECVGVKSDMIIKYKDYLASLDNGKYCKPKNKHITIGCAECDGGGAKYHPDNGVITIYYGRNTSSVDAIELLVSHELVHAADDCFGGSDFQNERHIACSEVRAYSQECQRGLPFRVGRSYDDCIRHFAEVSATKAGVPNASKVVNQVWTDCYVPEGATIIPPWPYPPK
jgi:mitochondrial inner membrane protease ATP23